ncbi:MAG: hypothetical protein QNJ94_21935 [Alphaproteobacteria bacterium]|nr:hypothetical protein [Alphaproteobacteria bacterium]
MRIPSLRKSSLTLAAAAIAASVSAAPALAESSLGDPTRPWFPKADTQNVLADLPAKASDKQLAVRPGQAAPDAQARAKELKDIDFNKRGTEYWGLYRR